MRSVLLSLRQRPSRLFCLRSIGSAGGDPRAPAVVRGSIPAGGAGVAVGQCAETERQFTVADVALFGKLVGDQNPLHRSWELSRLSSSPSAMDGHPLIQASEQDPKLTKVLAHGMLVASLFSSIFGTLIPGAVYISQSLDFRKPVYVDTVVVARVTITRIRRWTRKGLILTCDTTVVADGEEKVRGAADVWLPKGVEDSPSTG